jgi:hypothetical protein
MIAKFGDKGRDLDLDPDKDPKSKRRVDDPPEVASFKTVYNRLDSWRIFIETTRPDLVDEFLKFDLEGKRAEWLDRLKKAGKTFKEAFRNIGDTNPDAAKQAYVETVGKIESEINDLNRKIAAFFQGEDGSPKTIEEIIEEAHTSGTELWREAWRRAILQVNRVLARLWPPRSSKSYSSWARSGPNIQRGSQGPRRRGGLTSAAPRPASRVRRSRTSASTH